MALKTKARAEMERGNGKPLAHGAGELPAVQVNEYNFELRNKDGFIGDKANKSAFHKSLEHWRKLACAHGCDPLGRKPTADFSKRNVDHFVTGRNVTAAAVVWSAIDEFAHELSAVLERFLSQESWKGTEKVVVGGGFVGSIAGQLSIRRAQLLLASQGQAVELVRIRHHPDDAGLVGSAHLLPRWMLKGHQAILAVDIGGTNIRVGIVLLNRHKAKDFSKAKVYRSEIWRHAGDKPSRTASIERLAGMLVRMTAVARKKKLNLAPAVGIACPGIIEEAGSIARGAQNLPGGNWESDHFNLPDALRKAIPRIGEHESFFLMHNDAVVQGLSQMPFLSDTENWAVVTIGTGLGNAHFTSKTTRKG